MRDFEKTILKADHQPSVGPLMLSVTYETVGGPAVRPGSPFAPDVHLLYQLVKEVQGLRADLAERTLAGRLQRLGRRIWWHLRMQAEGWKLLLWP